MNAPTSRNDMEETIAQFLEPWAWDTSSYNATIARDDARAKAAQIIEAFPALSASAQPAEADGVERVCLDQNAVVGSLSFFLEEIDTRGLVEGEWVAKRLSRMIEEMGGFHWGAPGAMPSPEFAATLPAPNDDLRAALAWFSGQHRLSLQHYSPWYGDDDDQAVEWRVDRESGPINDREWDTIGRGDTADAAILAAYAAALTQENRRG